MSAAHQSPTPLPPLSSMLQGLGWYGLPASAQELARIIGLPLTLELVDWLGGCTLRVPLGTTPQGRKVLEDIARRLGAPAAAALARRYAGTEVYIPNCKQALAKARDAALLRDRDTMAAQGISERQIVKTLAQRYRLAERTVWRTLKRGVPFDLPQQRQASLLDDLS